MIRRISIFLFLFAFCAWLGASNSLAGNGADHPHGKFWAEGAGYVLLKGKGEVILDGFGLEMVLIRNVSKTKTKIKGQAVVIPIPDEDALLVVGLKGRIVLKGKKILFNSQGGKVSLKAAGKGVVWLKGKGVFKKHGKPPHKWPLDEAKKIVY
ncbi:MAG: hypothetical protein ACYTG7_08030 [Planctomycetota bacterium]|jgi:hypothetical protein